MKDSLAKRADAHYSAWRGVMLRQMHLLCKHDRITYHVMEKYEGTGCKRSHNKKLERVVGTSHFWRKLSQADQD